MYKPIIALDTGIVRGYSAGNNLQFLQNKQKYQKIFYTLNLLESAEQIQKLKSFDKERIVLVIRESDALEYTKDMDDLISEIKKAGFEIAFRIGFRAFPDIVRIRHWNPSYVMLDKSILSRLEAEPEFVHRVNSVILFGKELNYLVIAEGIQSEKELQRVLNLEIAYGRGKLLQCEKTGDTQLKKDAAKILANVRNNRKKEHPNMSLLRYVGAICKKGNSMLPNEKATTAYELFEKNQECSAICIVDEKERFQGILTRTNLIHAFGGRYGYNLHMRNTVMDLANTRALVVYKTFSIENVSRLAMERNNNEIYDPVVVLNRDKYYGIVTVKDLLSATVSIEVEKANEANPLTALPGNKVIEQKIHQLIGEQEFFAIIYLDLDNFKAFNDAYGFPNGDRMIEMLADAMKTAYGISSFLGHVGGDDFVIITRQPDVRKKAELMIAEFQKKIRELYNNTDWERGYIIAQSRKGVTEQFPIASISIAIITNQRNKYQRMMELTEQIVTAKKKAKQIEGNSIVIL